MYLKDGTKPSRIETLDVVIKFPVSLLRSFTLMTFNIIDANKKKVGGDFLGTIDLRA